MNKAQSKILAPMPAEIEDMKGKIADIRDELQESFDGKSEAWQEGEKGEAAQAVISSLTDAENSLQEAFDSLESALVDE